MQSSLHAYHLSKLAVLGYARALEPHLQAFAHKPVVFCPAYREVLPELLLLPECLSCIV